MNVLGDADAMFYTSGKLALLILEEMKQNVCGRLLSSKGMCSPSSVRNSTRID